MNLFQLVFVPLFVVTAVLGLVRSIRTSGRTRLNAAIMTLGALGGILVVASPQLSTTLGRHFGIGRGADFVVYVGLTVTLYSLIWLYRRVGRLERQLTRLIRTHAIERAARQESAAATKDEPRG